MSSHKVKIGVALLTFALLLTICIGSVYAYLSVSASSSNNLGPAVVATPEVQVSISEDAHTQKRTATGTLTVQAENCPLYVRVAVVINWINTNGEVCSSPVGADCAIDCPDTWVLMDSFYYYTKVVEAEENLTAEFAVEYSAPDEYQVQVQIISQTIQAVGTAEGKSAVEDAWGVDIWTN